MDNHQKKKINDELIKTFLIAGQESIDLRNKGLKKEIKSDNTPVTNGDIEVNKIITEKIKSLTPDIPIVSEESASNKSREDLNMFWLIDPIDGTYDYINNGDEFTLNAALIIDKKPELGIIFAPAKNRLFYSCSSGQSFEIVDDKLVRLTGEKRSEFEGIKAVSYSNELKPVISNESFASYLFSFDKMLAVQSLIVCSNIFINVQATKLRKKLIPEDSKLALLLL